MLREDGTPGYVRRHLRWGWWSLLAFALFGLILELLHGFKARIYLDVLNETRRLMWTLAHAHGIGLALVHVAFAVTLRALPDAPLPAVKVASWCLIGGGALLPGGFLLAGVWVYSGDPGLGVLLIPIGAGLVLAGVLTIARVASR